MFDTTLRDGEQSPGCTMSRDEKLAIARQLARLEVDIIEAGFPAASRGDFEAVQAIAGEIGSENGPIICGLARANREDIDVCWRAIETAAKPRIHTFLATSDIHLTYKLRMTRPQVLEAVRTMVAFARARVHRRRVLARGRRPQRSGISARGARGGDRGWRNDAQHSGHRRLHDAGRVRRDDRGHPRARARRARRRAVHALPR